MYRIYQFDKFTRSLNEENSLFGSSQDPFLISFSTDGMVNGIKNKSMGDLFFYGPKIPFVETTDNAKRRQDIIGDLQSLGINDDYDYEINRVELILGYHFEPKVREYGIEDIEFFPDFSDILVVVYIMDSRGEVIEEREIEVKAKSIEKFRLDEYDFNLPLKVTEIEISLPELEEYDGNWLNPENWDWEFKIGYKKE